MTLTPKRNGFQTRLRFGSGRRLRFLIAIDPAGGDAAREAAERIEERMQAMADLLAKSRSKNALDLLLEAASVASDAAKFRALERAVDKAATLADVAPVQAGAITTFRQVVEEWTSGRLRDKYPDAKTIRAKTDRGRKADRAMLATFLPVLGKLPVADITDADIAKAKALIPSGIDPDTRIVYLTRLRTVFRIARRPLRLIEQVPAEADELPAGKPRNIFWFMYPEEDALLLACTKIPLCYRVLYGWLNRNGTRMTETLLATHDHLDLERGTFHLEAAWTKTKRSRFWDLEPDVHAAMYAWRKLDGDPGPLEYIFHSQRRRKGKRLSVSTVQARFLSDLRRAGVDRRELHTTTKGARKLRPHDTRATFCTMARRRGMSDSWIMDRSGHEKPDQLAKYARFVRHADEQRVALWFAPMDQAIPELRATLLTLGQGWAKARHEPRKQAASVLFGHSNLESPTEANQAKTGQNPPAATPVSPASPHSGPAENQGVGQAGPGSPPAQSTPEDTSTIDSPVERALASALTSAIAAQEWELAKAIVAELGERRRARVAPGVPSLADVRAKKKGDGK